MSGVLDFIRDRDRNWLSRLNIKWTFFFHRHRPFLAKPKRPAERRIASFSRLEKLIGNLEIFPIFPGPRWRKKIIIY